MTSRSARSAQEGETSRRRRAPAPTKDGDIRDLFSFHLQRLAGLSTRIAAMAIRPKFGVTAREWRALAVLGYLKEAPLQELARHSGLLKSQMSRTVSILIDRGLIQRSANPEDGRSVLLRLSRDGEALARQILAESHQRNERMLAALPAADRRRLVELVQRVFKTSLAYYAEMKELAPAFDPQEGEDD